MPEREPSVCQQTGALLYKNLLSKWRNKTQTLQEWLLSIALLLVWMTILAMFYTEYHDDISEMPTNVLGRVDEFDAIGRVLGYTPRTKSAKQIMEKVASRLNGTGITIEDFENEETMTEAWNEDHQLLGVVFKDSFTYDIRISSHVAPIPHDHLAILGACLNYTEYCSSAQYWSEGFLFLQTSIDSAIIEITTNHSVWEEMKSAVAVLMKFQKANLISKIPHGVLIVMFSLSFCPLLYFLSFIVAREKMKHKDLMTIMGLQESAFWLSWGLLYSGFICIMANVLTLMTKYIYFEDSCYSVILLLHFLYGLSSICFCFLLSSLLKKPKLTSIVGFLLTLTFACLSLIFLVDRLPTSVAWALGMLFSPCAFSIGLTQIIYLENEDDGANFSLLLEGPFPLLAVFFVLVLNGIFYMLLAIYFDKVLPNTYGTRYSPLFFLKSSYWSKSKQPARHENFDNEESSDANVSDFIEPVPREFHGKQAIRIKHVKKTYEEDRKVEALQGLLFDVYEGQITALLGHSGAGKTTLLNILSGISSPSDGAVSIYKQPLWATQSNVQLEKNIGFCPQFNIKFDILTVKENLRLFAKVKGVPTKDVEQEVQKVLSVLDIIKIQDIRAASLSGGQSRKLTLGIAILGDPQILLLDEPTAGLDPCSRHHVWTLLKERKAGRVTLFSTQFMDEADILADRKAVLSKGRLKCVGTSMFLKRKWGIGYHLRMHVNESCDAEEMTSVVKNHIPNAKLSRQHEQELIYILPFENVESFPELFSDLDTRSGQEIANYGVSMTSLEDVFLKLEGEEAIDQADYGVFSQEPLEEDRGSCADDEMEQTLLSLSEMGNATVSGLALWRQQVLAIAKVRFLKLKHESKTLRSVLLLFLIILIPMVLLITIVRTWNQFLARELTPDLYLLRPEEQPYKHYRNLLVQNDTGSNIDSLIRSIRSQNINLDVIDWNNTEDDLQYNTVVRVSRDKEHYRFTFMTSIRMINGFPVLLNVISNAFLRTFNSTGHIRVWNSPFIPTIHDFMWMNIFTTSSFLFGIFGSGFPPHIAMSSVQDGKIKALSQLRLSGLFPSAYWCGQALVDITVFWALLAITMGFLLTFNHTVAFSPLSYITLIACITGYAPSLILLIYVISFICRKGKNNPDFWSCILIVISMTSFIIIGIVMFYTSGDHVGATKALLNLFIPVVPLISCFTSMQVIDYYESDSGIERAVVASVIAPYLHCILFLFLLRCLEMRYGKKIFRRDPVFRISPKSAKVCPNPDEPEGDEEEEESVQDERTRVRETIAIQRPEEESAIVASSLRKEYKDKKASSIFRKKKKVATSNVSFCVKKGEILGLLGPNGAGKTTTIRMLTGDTKPTAGQVLITRIESTSAGPRGRENESTGFLGYCPQENPLWPNLTVKEHLEVFAAVKGMKKGDAAVAITRVTDTLELKENLKMAARKLSEGVKRKLCFALSMLGNPTIVLLDEPSTGMDPKGQQRMWRAIRAAFKKNERGAILTTHYMEEAEAVCDRVAIMVSGKLRCIGSIQQLKSKFGKGYFLEIKVRDQQQVDVLHKEILKIFPQAARQERFSSLLSYKIPMENVKSLSQAFSMLEEVKRTFTLEEYSFSQSTLEQVFIELTKEQDKDNVDPASGSNFEWKKLQEEDT